MTNGVFSIPFPPLSGGIAAATTTGRKRCGSRSASFIVGPENRLARIAAETFLLPAGSEAAFHPLVIYGPSGCGKSHLTAGLVAIWTARYPHAHVWYIRGSGDLARSDKSRQAGISKTENEDRLAEFPLANRAGQEPQPERMGPPKTKNLLSQQDVWRPTTLIVAEDLDRFTRQRSLQRQLESWIDRLQRIGGKLIVTASTSPAALSHLSPMLRSRLVGGLVINLTAPQQAARMAIVLNQARLAGIKLTETALQEVVRQRRDASVANLVATVDRLAQATAPDASGVVDQRAVCQFFCLERAPGRRPEQIPIHRILTVVARQYGLKPADLRGRSRRRGVALARSMAMYLASRHAHHSLKKIGRSLGQRDHTTVMHSCRNIEKSLASDPACQKLVQELVTKIESHP